jgi:hypothetical protein
MIYSNLLTYNRLHGLGFNFGAYFGGWIIGFAAEFTWRRYLSRILNFRYFGSFFPGFPPEFADY